MKYPIYSIRDKKSGYGFPQVDTNDFTCKRGFALAINNNDLMNANPDDYEVYKIGTFDTDKGKIDAFNITELVCTGLEVHGAKV